LATCGVGSFANRSALNFLSPSLVIFAIGSLILATVMEEPSPNCENDTPPVVNDANVVAIDNKIEQAMDLVKTHLLYAVREEVEVLKERIVELETKIARLEVENNFLRTHAPVEIIQFIQQQQDQEQNDSTSEFNNPSMAASLPQHAFNVLQTPIQQST